MYSNKKIKRYFELAKNASTFSDYSKYKIGAILVYKNKVASVGYNQKRSSPIQKAYNVYRKDNEREYDEESKENFIHAEVHCLLNNKTTMDLSKCSLFVFRSKKDGSCGLAKPCLACQKLIKDYGIKNIYYTTDNGFNYERKEN